MDQDYNQSVDINAEAQKAFVALTEEIDKWWGKVNAPVNGIGDVFTITFREAFWTFKITAFQPGKRLTWECIEGQPELNHEWIGHQLKWTIAENDNSIKVTFDQAGLNASLPCYDICSAAWDRFILHSLKAYLETGNGQPGS